MRQGWHGQTRLSVPNLMHMGGYRLWL